jgi:arylsulfatase A-like enzyme
MGPPKARRPALAALPLFLVTLCGLGCPAQDPGPGSATALQGAVVILLDTLRADRLSAYGNLRTTSPNIDALAREGVLFERAIANSSWTLPSTVGLLTGTYPSKRVFDRTLKRSLAEDLQRAGFATAAFTEGGYFSRAFGLDLGFASYEEEESAVRLAKDGMPYAPRDRGGIDKTFARAESWLRTHSGEPFFLVIQTYETHTPYRRRTYAGDRAPSAIGPTFETAAMTSIREEKIVVGPEEIAYITDLYDGGVTYADHFVGRFRALLAELGIADRTLLVVTSDHGEDLGDRVPGRAGDHGHTLFDELVRIPLIVHVPGREFAVERVQAQVRGIDILPTVMDLLDLEVPMNLHGRSLVPLMEGSEEQDRTAASWTLGPPHGQRTTRMAYSDGQYKLTLVHPRAENDPPRIALFHLPGDPGEERSVTGAQRARAARMSQELHALFGEVHASGLPDYRLGPEVGDEIRARLQALGYVVPAP